MMAVAEIEGMIFREVGSKSELLEILRSCGADSILIGTDAESPRTCFLLELTYAGAHIKIGMIMGFHGIKPSWALSPAEHTIAIGHDLTVSFIDLSEHRLVSSQKLDGPFYQLLLEDSGDHFIALHELGVDRFDCSGAHLWSVSTPDVTEGAYFLGDRTLVVRYWEGKHLLVDLATGRDDEGGPGALAPEIENLGRAYAAFNARNMDLALATMQPDVVWPNGMEGGTVQGHDGVRAYWTRQWRMIDPHVDPVRFTEDESGRIAVSVHQVVRDLSGNVLMDRMVEHVYTLKDGFIQSMDIRE